MRAGAAAVVMMVVMVVLAGAASAQPAARLGAAVDWGRGLVTATSVGLADRHAPSPVAARGPARRRAEERARAELAVAVAALPLAGGGTLAGKLGDAAVKARVDRAVAAAIVVDAEPSTDGSWRVTLAVPIEAIRLAVGGGPRVVPAAAADGDGPAVVVVELASAVAPKVGVVLGGHAAAAVWVAEVPAWAKDAPRVKGRVAGGGGVTLDRALGSASTLFVIVSPR